MHSPVWLDYDSDKEAGETFTDLEYYLDDYYDHAPEAAIRDCVDEEKAKLNAGKKRKRSSQPRGNTKRKRVDHTDAIPGLSLGEPLGSSLTETSSSSAVVCWKTTNTFTTFPLPLLADDEGEKVALLKDWRDRFKIRRRDDTKDLATESQDYGVPVMKGGVLLVDDRGNKADGTTVVHDGTAAAEVVAEQNHMDSMTHTNPEAFSNGVSTMSNGATPSGRGLHLKVPKKARTAMNGTNSRKRHVDMDEESEPREIKRKAAATTDTQPDARPTSYAGKSVARQLRGDHLPEPTEQTGIALYSHEVMQHNLQHDSKLKASVPDMKPEKLTEAGKENGGLSQRPSARRSTRATRGP